MENFIERNFQTTIVQKAKATMLEFQEDPDVMPTMLYNICVHLEVCFIISDMNYIDNEGKAFTAISGQGNENELRPQYEVIEGLPRTTAWMVQRTLAQQYNLEVPKYLADMFDYQSKRFIEVGITKGVAEDYYWRKKEKLGDTMDLMIFSYEQHYSLSNEESLDEEGRGRVLSRLTELQAELSGKNLWTTLLGEEEGEVGYDFEMKPTIKRMRDLSTPAGFIGFEELREYIDQHDTHGAIERAVGRMSRDVSVTGQKVEWEDLRPLAPGVYDKTLPEVNYSAFLLMGDEFGLAKESDGGSKRPVKIIKDCLDRYPILRDCTEPILMRKSQKANEGNLWKLWRDCVNQSTSQESLEIPKNNWVKWATGDGLTYQKVTKEMAMDDETMKQEVPRIPEKRRFSPWVQTEMNILSSLTNKRALELPEIGPDLAPIEVTGTERREFFQAEINNCKASTVMMKYVLFSTSVLNECAASMGKYKVVPIRNRIKNEKGEMFDSLFGMAVKGLSHLRADTDVVSVVTYEFSLTDPRIHPEKWERYTVFQIGSIFIGNKERTVYLYARVNGTNKIKLKWGMEARRCILQSMQQMESIIDQESSVQGYDMTKACFMGDRTNPAKTVTVGTSTEGLIRGSFGKALRVIFTKCLMHFVFGDSQLEGFSAESRRLMLIIQALKDSKHPYAFDLNGLYEGIEECVSNNPWVLQSVVWFNEWLSAEKTREQLVFKDDLMIG
uniref:PA n=1 Tax=Wuhan spiny eel influenza virus TaxID=2116483 RepID=A0A2P1GNP2_9ORTO|nr:PA [Wuhan spiny eel influenza virus]